MKSLISWVSPATRNTTVILTEREGESQKRKMHVEMQTPVSNSAYPLSFLRWHSTLATFLFAPILFISIFSSCFDLYPVTFPFHFSRRKNQRVCISLWRRRENREMCSCGWAGDCRGSGDRWGRRASKQQ
ncbi:unnamed protein product [Rangifer tarandus platyrhynchus]|uniref:Uncharacterized protein n=1 Tax=Rangifer tarandus platyrhynchus TaxID=3082113 RepID=A0AC59ZUE1_RANTA